jgi:hypothetical protein
VENVATPRQAKMRPTGPALRLYPHAIAPWAAILGLIALAAGGLAAHAGGLLVYLFPLSALAVGALLYWRYPDLYLGFAWWLWFLTPEVRRLVDYQAGWNPQNPIMLAPYLVAALTLFTLLRHLPKLQFSRLFPFGLIFLGLFYGYCVGIYRGGWQATTYDLINWLIPVTLAFHLVVHWRDYPRYRKVVQRTFVWGVLVMGLYGLLQFFNPPIWDQYWMNSAPITSIGSPEPFEVRVFSTSNSPGPFAVVMLAGLLSLMGGGSMLRWPAAGVGFASFLLSLVRSAWGAWVLGLIFIVAQRGRLRQLATLVAMGAIVLPLLTVGPVAETVNARLQSVSDLEQDNSFKDRVAFYSEFLPQALLNPVGEGLGSTGLATKLSTSGGELGEFGNFDSGLMNIPFVLGWLGSLLYVSGLIWLLLLVFRGGGPKSDAFAAVSRGIAVAMLAQLVFGNSLVSLSGIIFWSFLGLSLAARVHNTHAPAVNAKPPALGSVSPVVSSVGDGR